MASVPFSPINPNLELYASILSLMWISKMCIFTILFIPELGIGGQGMFKKHYLKLVCIPICMYVFGVEIK